MACLVDTSVLVRFAHRADVLHGCAASAITALRSRGQSLVVSHQNVAEFWCVVTRPTTSRGGLGLLPAQADLEVQRLERLFAVLPEAANTYAEWRRLIVAHGVSGTQAHDARLAAVMITNGVSEILTFNITDFVRYGALTVLDPRTFGSPSAGPVGGRS